MAIQIIMHRKWRKLERRQRWQRMYILPSFLFLSPFRFVTMIHFNRIVFYKKEINYQILYQRIKEIKICSKFTFVYFNIGRIVHR